MITNVWTILLNIENLKRGIFSNPRNDRTKGCPYPTCTRYGRAFSRAHDLKRHIARHAMRKEKIIQVNQQKPDLENAINDTTLQGALLRGVEDKGFPCPRCKKRYSDEDKLKVHLVSHGKVLSLIIIRSYILGNYITWHFCSNISNIDINGNTLKKKPNLYICRSSLINVSLYFFQDRAKEHSDKERGS